MAGPVNVVLAMTDQQRFDTLGCAGSRVETVNMDWLAAQGTRFTNAYSATPSCIPARASLMTGMDPWHTGILGMGPGQPGCGNLSNTLPQLLGDAGYHTQGVGKMHFKPQRSLQGFHHTILDESARVQDPGFVSDYVSWFDANRPGDVDRYEHGIDQNSWMSRPYHLPEWLHATNWTAGEAIRFLRRRDPTRPFFLKCSFARPHSPYDAPPWYFDLYDRSTLLEPAIGEWASVHDVPHDAADPNAWHGRRSPAEIHRARAGYYGSIHHIDHQLGRLLTELRRQRLDDDTLIIFTADHGDMMGDHNLWRKTYAYEGSAHVPLIVRPPAAMRDSVQPVSDLPVCLQDIMPTILDAAQVAVPETVDGASLLPLMTGDGEAGWRDAVHGEHSTCYAQSEEMQYLTDGDWKYIWFTRTGTEQLFHLADDPYECTDLAGDTRHADRLRRWRSHLIGILETRDAGLTSQGRLVSQQDRPYLVSPHAQERP